MLVPDVLGVKVLLVSGLVDLLEDVLETAIVLLQDGVFGAHVQREALSKSELETGVGEAADGVISVVLGLSDTATLEIVDLDGLGLAAHRGVDELKLSRSRNDTVSSTVLVTESVTTDDDGLGPAGNKAGNAGNDNGLTENSSATSRSVSYAPIWRRMVWNVQNVTDGSVGREPH
jgi:hypothetical protein